LNPNPSSPVAISALIAPSDPMIDHPVLSSSASPAVPEKPSVNVPRFDDWLSNERGQYFFASFFKVALQKSSIVTHLSRSSLVSGFLADDTTDNIVVVDISDFSPNLMSSISILSIPYFPSILPIATWSASSPFTKTTE
jgi:hypothetical protein